MTSEKLHEILARRGLDTTTIETLRADVWDLACAYSHQQGQIEELESILRKQTEKSGPLLDRVYSAETTLEHLGYRRCDLSACNCGGYHRWGNEVDRGMARFHRLLDAYKRIAELEKQVKELTEAQTGCDDADRKLDGVLTEMAGMEGQMVSVAAARTGMQAAAMSMRARALNVVQHATTKDDAEAAIYKLPLEE